MHIPVVLLQADGTWDALLRGHEHAVLLALLQRIDGRPPLELEVGVRTQAAQAVLCAAMCDEGRDLLWELGAPTKLRNG